jgi:CubicO group peptidase (beta-lactamase class C family)
MKFIKRILAIVAILLISFELILQISNKLYVNRLLRDTVFSGKMGPDIYELNLFQYNTIGSDTPQPWPIAKFDKPYQLPDSSLKLLDEYETDYLLVIKDKHIIYEYTNAEIDHQKNEPVNSFSMAKSFTGLLIGCALLDGYINSLDDAIKIYIPEWANDSRGNITIRNLLSMSSGLAYNENYASPFSWPAEAYYGPDVNKLTLSGELIDTPGTKWSYKGGDSQLLGIILKRVTGKSVAQYASDRLWKPMGAEFPAYWSTDERGMEKVSCCWYSFARDFARSGRLMMQYGKWNNRQLIDSAYIAESITPAPVMDENGMPNNKYGYQWWLMQHRGHDIFYARGIRGQYILCIPDENMIVVRLGHKRAPKAGHNVPVDVYTYLDVGFDCARNYALPASFK